MKDVKRFLAFVLAIAICMSLVSMVAFAEGEAAGTLSWTADVTSVNAKNEEWIKLSIRNESATPISSLKLYLYCDPTVFKVTEEEYDEEGEYTRGGVNFKGQYSGECVVTNIADDVASEKYNGYAGLDGYSLVWFKASGKNVSAKAMCDIYLKVAQGAPNGSYKFYLGVSQAVAVVDGEETDIAFNVPAYPTEPITVTVSGGVDKLTDSNVTFSGLNTSYTYTGSAIEPSFAVEYGTKTLTKGTDYEVSYTNNTNAGTATITVTGKGNYQGEVSEDFTIAQAEGKITGTDTYSKTYGAEAFLLDAAANFDTTLSYESKDTNVATVDANGRVTIVGTGDAVITVSAEGSANYSKPDDFEVAVTVGKANQSLTGTPSYTKTYGDDSFTLDVSGNKGTLSYTSSAPTVADVDSATGVVTIKGVGTATITAAAAADNNYNAATKEVTVKVNQKEVSVSGITANDKEYDKTTAAVVDKSAAVLSGKVGSDDLDYTVTGAFANANAGENKTVNLTVTLTGTSAANYKLADDSQKTAAATINKAEVAVPTAKTGLTYNKNLQVGVAETTDYTVSGGTKKDVGDYIANVTLTDADNYKWADDTFDGKIAWSIAKADADDLSKEFKPRYSSTDDMSLTLADIAAMLGEDEDTIAITDCEFGGDDVLGKKEFTADAITFALKGGLTEDNAGDQAVITATIECDNYNDVTLTVTVTVQDKIDVSENIVFAGGSAIYDGAEQTHETAKYNDSTDGIRYEYDGDRTNVGTFKVTAIYEDADNYGEKEVSFRIDPKQVRVTGGEVKTRDYDGTTDAALESVEFVGVVPGESLTEADYTVTSAAYEDANAGANKNVSFEVELTNKNYVLTGSIPTVKGAIDPREITVTLGAVADQQFTGNALTPTVTVSSDETIDSYVLIEGTDYEVSYDENTNVGTAEAVVESLSGSNYSFKESTTFNITEIAASEIADISDVFTYKYSGEETWTIVIPDKAGEVSYELGTPTGETNMVSNVSVSNGKISLTVEAVDESYIGKSVTIPVTVKMQNYVDQTIDLVIERSDRDRPTLAVQPITKTYDGAELTNEDINGTATFRGETVEGDWTWVTPTADMVNAKEEGYTAKVKFTPDDIETYLEVEAEVTVVIKKATPTGSPSYTKVRASGKTLTDAALGVGSITLEGTIAWADSVDTVIERGKQYQWIFTPTDLENYNVLTGTVSLYANTTFRPSTSKDKEDREEKDEEEVAPSVIDQFADVRARDWYAEAVEAVVSEGLFGGVSDDLFAPNITMTRGMLVTVLWRMDGKPAAQSDASFRDVAAHEYYADPVAWASANGIVTGISDTHFAPQQSITREQMAAILFRYAKALGLDSGERADLSAYADASSISAYAAEAMAWAVAEGLISGMTATTLAPKGTATRAQVAMILMRFMENVK